MTAIEWLYNELSKNNTSTDSVIERIDKESSIWEQAKAMEEKQMIRFAEFVASYPDKNKNADGEMLHAKSKYDGAERTIDLLKEYYKL